jgi:hypothetical protein
LVIAIIHAPIAAAKHEKRSTLWLRHDHSPPAIGAVVKNRLTKILQKFNSIG